ncbi:MAG: ABC transporter substrate-binding protein [Alphaproteobacteria bacterium]|nr:ABC transporter substrate-binding protein [Alphaproteobacteria bacterium]
MVRFGNPPQRSASRHGATKTLLLMGGALAVVVGLFTTGPAQAGELIKCAYPYWFGFAPTLVAQDLGYFAEEGLEVDSVFDNDRANVYPALETNEIQCTMRTIGEHMSRPLEADSNYVVIGVIDVSVGADGVVAAPGIDKPTDLIGKIFAGEINHPGTLMLAYALKQAGHSLSEVDMRLIATDDGQAVFEDPEVSAVATWEPMLSGIVATTSRKGSKILLSSKDFNGLITDVVIVNKEDYNANRGKYEALMRGIYRAVDLFNKDPEKFLASAAPQYDVTSEVMMGDLGGVYYTSYEDALEFFGVGGQPSKLKSVIDSLNTINVDLDLQDENIPYEAMVDPSLTEGLFDGKKR